MLSVIWRSFFWYITYSSRHLAQTYADVTNAMPEKQKKIKCNLNWLIKTALRNADKVYEKWYEELLELGKKKAKTHKQTNKQTKKTSIVICKLNPKMFQEHGCKK